MSIFVSCGCLDISQETLQLQGHTATGTAPCKELVELNNFLSLGQYSKRQIERNKCFLALFSSFRSAVGSASVS